MRILLIHNRYQQPGGEDNVFQSEKDLLVIHGHTVDQLVYDNSTIQTLVDKCISGLNSIYNWSSGQALRSKIEDFNPDIIHIHNFLPLISPSVLFVAKKYEVPVVLTLHNYRLLCPSATLFYNGSIYEKSIRSIVPFDAIWKGVYRNSIMQTAMVALITATHHILGTWKGKVDQYITLTEFARNKFEQSALSIPADKFTVKPNFVEDHGNGSEIRDDFFLYVGRLVEEKGISTLVGAASLLDFKLVIIGDGPLRSLVEEAAELNSNITYLGQQPRADVQLYLKRSTALIFPSIWYEGFPLTILEAFSTGTPVIASNLGSMKEIVKDHCNGLHFEPGSVLDLAVKVAELQKNDVLTRELSQNARRSYLKYYTPSKNYEQLMSVYDSALEQRAEKKIQQEIYQLLR